MPTDIDILRKIDRIHPYPAKFPVDLAMNYISKYTNIGNTVYDPFVGSGTTLLASRALERNAYGTDVNHIAVLISQFKLLSLSQNDIAVAEKNGSKNINKEELQKELRLLYNLRCSFINFHKKQTRIKVDAQNPRKTK